MTLEQNAPSSPGSEHRSAGADVLLVSSTFPPVTGGSARMLVDGVTISTLSAPKRAMSKRAVAAAIISMAQQARPNCNGQMELVRPQLYPQSPLMSANRLMKPAMPFFG